MDYESAPVCPARVIPCYSVYESHFNLSVHDDTYQEDGENLMYEVTAWPLNRQLVLKFGAPGRRPALAPDKRVLDSHAGFPWA